MLKQDSREINEAAFCEAADSPRVVIFPWARASFDNKYERRKRLFNYFRNLGASTVDFVDYGDALEEIRRRIEFSDLVYLTGGLTTVLIERLRSHSVDVLLRKYDKVIVGRSAGALALCKKCVLTDRRKSAVRVINGLGLVNIGVKVHYKSSDDVELKRLSKIEMIYAIPERSALVYDNGCFSSIGDVYVFRKGGKERPN